MTIRLIDTDEIMDMEDGLAVRMVEQGKAILAEPEPEPEPEPVRKSTKGTKKGVTADEPENEN